MHDQCYRDFMLDVLRNLEPIALDPNTIIYNELDETDMIHFFTKGRFSVGFNVNLETRFPLSYKYYRIIGVYGVTFFKRSQYIYKTKTNTEGFFIRRKNWKNIIDPERNDRNVIHELKELIIREYEVKISRRMNFFKLEEIKRQRNRADYESHKFNSGYNDKGLLKSAMDAKNHETLKYSNTLQYETHRALHHMHGDEKMKSVEELSGNDLLEGCDEALNEQVECIKKIMGNYDQTHLEKEYYKNRAEE